MHCLSWQSALKVLLLIHGSLLIYGIEKDGDRSSRYRIQWFRHSRIQ